MELTLENYKEYITEKYTDSYGNADEQGNYWEEIEFKKNMSPLGLLGDIERVLALQRLATIAEQNRNYVQVLEHIQGGPNYEQLIRDAIDVYSPSQESKEKTV